MKLSILLVLCTIPFALICQNNALRVYGGWELTGDHITADATLGVYYRLGLNRCLYFEPFLRAGHGSQPVGIRLIPNQNPENYIGIDELYVFEGS